MKSLRRYARIVAAPLLVLCILIYPLPVRDADRDYVVQRDAFKLRNVRPVLLDWRFQPFYDAKLVATGNPKWHLYCDFNLDLSSLEKSGFTRIVKKDLEDISWGEWYENGNVLLEITDNFVGDRNVERGLFFHVHHGTLGGQVYRLHVWRCLLGTIARYSIVEVS